MATRSRPSTGRHRSTRAATIRRTAGVVSFGVALAVLPAPSLGDLPPPMEVRLDDGIRLVPPNATVSEVREVLDLRPEDGALVDVEGVVLRPAAFPGYLEVNGERAAETRVLRPGDEIAVVDERDHFEPLTTERRTVEGGQIANPQTHLGTTPGEQILTKGAISGKLLSSAFHPTGPADVPRAVALTFDDGPSPTFTPQIVEILQEHDAVATFFTIGVLVERYPDVVRQALDAGMAVANHSRTHPGRPPFAELPRSRQDEEMRLGRRALVQLGAEPRSFRPPGGSWSQGVVEMARERGERVVLWSIDTLDWREGGPRDIARRVLSRVEPGSIILLHDGGGDRGATIRALPRILRGLKQRGFAFETL